MCREAGLTMDDLDRMTIGMTLDYIEEYLSLKDPKHREKTTVVEFADDVPWL